MDVAKMQKCKRCGLPKSGSIPYGLEMEYEQLNPDFCAWCNAVLLNRLRRERNPDSQSMLVRGQQQVAAGVCPECGCTLFQGSGCYNCPSCGFEKCA